MARKVYISFKAEDMAYKAYLQEQDYIDYVDKSLNTPINSTDPDYIIRKIREDYLKDSTVTIHLIGLHGSENAGPVEQRYIKGELQASFYAGGDHSKNGVLGIVLPEANGNIFQGTYICSNCGNSHNYVNIGDSTTIKEFSYNYYIPNNKCAHAEDDRYCALVKWDDFLLEPSAHIEKAFDKRTAPIASKTKVRP